MAQGKHDSLSLGSLDCLCMSRQALRGWRMVSDVQHDVVCRICRVLYCSSSVHVCMCYCVTCCSKCNTDFADKPPQRKELKATHKYITQTPDKQSNMTWLLHAPVHMCGHKGLTMDESIHAQRLTEAGPSS